MSPAGGKMHENQETGCRCPLGEASGHACPPFRKPACAAFEVYEEVPKTVPLDFTEDDVTWVASKLSGAAGALGAEALELCNWLLHFGCMPEELIVIVSSLAYWMANPPPPPGPHIAH